MDRHQKYRASEKGQKTIRTRNWKKRGLIGDYNMIYNKYINTEYCDLCHKKFKNSQDRHMEHSHITGEFRHICCKMCNLNMPDKKYKIGQYGYKHIAYSKRDKCYKYQRNYMGNKYQKQFKSKIDCLCYKYIMILKINSFRKK